MIKQRVARKGGRRATGFRTIVTLRRGELAFFVYGFAKRDWENLRPNEVSAFRALTDAYLALDEVRLNALKSVGAIIEVVR